MKWIFAKTLQKSSFQTEIRKDGTANYTFLSFTLHSYLGVIKETCLFDDTDFRKNFTEKLISNWNKKRRYCQLHLALLHSSLFTLT